MSTRLPFASQLLTSAIGLALSLGLLSSCDEFIPEPTEAGKPVEPQIAPPPAEPTAEQQAQAVASVYEYANCAGSCLTSGEHKAPTNHATCRLNCKQALDTSLAKQAMRLPALASVPELNKQLDGCTQECKAETSADNRATCMLTCTNKIREEARSLKLEPDAVPPKQDSCGSKCSARLELCTDKCTSDRKQSADDRATCNLMCKTEETTCRETCAKTQPGTLK